MSAAQLLLRAEKNEEDEEVVVSAVLVPSDQTQPLQSVSVAKDPQKALEGLVTSLQPQSWAVQDVRPHLLLRSSPTSGTAGLYAYDVTVTASKDHDGTSSSHNPNPSSTRNVRATRLAMACGLFYHQLFGNVLLVRSDLASRQHLSVHEVYGACCLSPDLRSSVQHEMMLMMRESIIEDPVIGINTIHVPTWLGDALQQNYHDAAVLSRLAQVMLTNTSEEDDEDDDSTSTSSDDTDDNSAKEKDSTNPVTSTPTSSGPPQGSPRVQDTTDDVSNNKLHSDNHRKHRPPRRRQPEQNEFLTKQPLCLHCRRPASSLCIECQACYFCNSPTRKCRAFGWTHDCQCATWRLYTERRSTLSDFPFLRDWAQELTKVEFQTSEEPYEAYLRDSIGLQINTDGSWWLTELGGWAGGNSASARTVDISVRKTYAEGFAPLPEKEIPPQRPVEEDDILNANKYLSASNTSTVSEIERNSLGFLSLSGWEDYYRLRQLPPSSIAALLLTFPLTTFHAIVKYGEVPCTVARMLKRPLRVHIVGVEKEANFLDLFQEVGWLLPQDFAVELCFIVRDDMLPPKCRPQLQSNNPQSSAVTMNGRQSCPNLSIKVVSGTYGDSLDPNFDCGTGPPDMVIGMNAGLFAYETWRSVVTYLHRNRGIVGLFTDYNEYSGVNCASLAGAAGRESLCVNPFRQPRVMPVYSMNLPQFSNGFFYVVNAQELELSR